MRFAAPSPIHVTVRRQPQTVFPLLCILGCLFRVRCGLRSGTAPTACLGSGHSNVYGHYKFPWVVIGLCAIHVSVCY